MNQVLLRWYEYSSHQNIPKERKKGKAKHWRGKKKSQRKFLPSGAIQFNRRKKTTNKYIVKLGVIEETQLQVTLHLNFKMLLSKLYVHLTFPLENSGQGWRFFKGLGEAIQKPKH